MKPLVAMYSRKRQGGFSLVEVAMALAIMGFACISLIGMIPIGITSFHQAMGNTVESEIVQNLSNDILLADANGLGQYTTQSFYYDSMGVPLTTSANAVYTATITLAPVSSANSPTSLVYNNGVTTSTAGANTSAFNLTITIQCVNNPLQPHKYSVIVSNNNEYSQ